MLDDDPGWRRIGPDPAILAWVQAALPVARQALAQDPAPRRAGDTWAVGLDLLPNAPDGGIAGVAFPWPALPLDPVSLPRAQLSTVFPGYPRTDPDETQESGTRRVAGKRESRVDVGRVSRTGYSLH